MKFPLLITHYVLLITAGLVALARYFHPATFSPHVLTLLLTTAVIAVALQFWNQE